MTHFARLSLVFSLSVAIPACGFPRPPTVTDDATPGGDAAPASDAALGTDDALGTDAPGRADASIDAAPGSTIYVAGTGDDSNDGMTAPIKTLKHAIGLAAADVKITHIVLAPGRYASAGGELFPYALPPNVTLIGPAGGGAILAGSNAETGVILGAGALQDLELEDFTTAIDATGAGRISNLHIRTNTVAVRAEAAAMLTVQNLDITGASGACAVGVDLHGAADLVATNLVTRALATSVNAQDQSTVSLSAAHLTGAATCMTPATGVLMLSTTKVITMNDSLIDAGYIGIYFTSTGTSTPATVKNTTISNAKLSAITGSKYTLEMTGGTLSNAATALGASAANVNLTNVAINHSGGFAFELGDGGGFTMRGCTTTQNAGGIYVYGNMSIDLGTTANLGNNTFQNGNTTGIEIDAGNPAHVTAVGNTWRPNVQGADNGGHYASATVTGPVGYSAQSNYSVSTTGSLQL